MTSAGRILLTRFGAAALLACGSWMPSSAGAGMVPWAVQVHMPEVEADVTQREFADLLTVAVPPTPEQSASVTQAILELASPKFDVRRGAVKRLISVGLPGLPMLRTTYFRSHDFEVRIRIQEVAGAIFLEENLYKRNAFLGVSMGGMGGRTSIVTHAMDPRVPKDGDGIEISEVVSGTAADDAGMRANDVVILLDGLPVRGTLSLRDPASFSEKLRKLGVGTTVKLTVLRGPQTLELQAVLRDRPRAYYDEHQHPDFFRLEQDAKRAFQAWWREVFTVPDTKPPPVEAPEPGKQGTHGRLPNADNGKHG